MGYNKNNKIGGSPDTNFESLRSKIQNLITTRKTITGPGDSDFNNYTAPATISNSITAAQQQINNKINTSPFINGIKTIQDLLKKGYMKPMGTVAESDAATRIKNSDDLNQNSIIPALTDFYTVVNYWNNGNSETNHNGCNGACVGYCTGSCSSTNMIGSNRQDSRSGSNNCNELCNSCCHNSCEETCYGQCENFCKGNCVTACDSACGSGVCVSYCGGGCDAACGIDACNSTCDGACTGCDSGCNTGCGSGCAGACFGCSGGNGPIPAA